jgi:hypothetical protein
MPADGMGAAVELPAEDSIARLHQLREQAEGARRRFLRRMSLLLVHCRPSPPSGFGGLSADGPFDVVVIDPPWPMQKIDRDVGPVNLRSG